MDVHLHDTYFIVAHFHDVMMGGTVTAFIGVLNLWWPKIWSKMYSRFRVRIAAGLSFVGFNMSFLPSSCSARGECHAGILITWINSNRSTDSLRSGRGFLDWVSL